MRSRTPAWARWALLIVLTVGSTAALTPLGVPSPALFAGLVVATVLALAGLPVAAPGPVNGAAQAVIGVVIGVLAQPGTLAGLAGQWVPVLLVSVATLAVSMAAGLLLGLRRGISPLTGMLALTAGGASGLVAVSRELGGDDRTVAVVQYLRVGMVTATMPVVATLGFGAAAGAGPGAPGSAPLVVDIGYLAVCAVAGTVLARAARVPAGALLGPMVVAIAINMTGWSFGAIPPAPLVEIAYAVIGWQAGARFTRESLRTVLGALLPAATLVVGVIVACAGLGLLLSTLTGTTPLDGYLATTPGGVYAVLATAVSAGTDVTFVMAVQVLRVIVMLLVTPAIARLAGRALP
ncbi:AbrB family transcriptional regulator [Pseudonocardia sp. DSM 110487]|uniref:AbrB family transcriptional regulator n=1 Tax=Pseudonocardia sp. DSM 110487 TaxID=2865833 RepID=UPI001C6A7376|nr:AbrB family transcriptional regulator [Pseudonocardia sp. DSM 110487]QYN31917.1 AbrB family transcriptional regulator [Pseudonocardia sp. DSM 110487]